MIELLLLQLPENTKVLLHKQNSYAVSFLKNFTKDEVVGFKTVQVFRFICQKITDRRPDALILQLKLKSRNEHETSNKWRMLKFTVHEDYKESRHYS